MKKLITLSTLTAGIGVSAFGLNIHHADAAELTQNQATQQVNQQKQNQNVIHYNEAKSKKSSLTSKHLLISLILFTQTIIQILIYI